MCVLSRSISGKVEVGVFLQIRKVPYFMEASFMVDLGVHESGEIHNNSVGTYFFFAWLH
jgi:hypothetical protein